MSDQQPVEPAPPPAECGAAAPAGPGAAALDAGAFSDAGPDMAALASPDALAPQPANPSTTAPRAANSRTTAARAANSRTTAARAANSRTTGARAANSRTTAARAANPGTTAPPAANPRTTAARTANPGTTAPRPANSGTNAAVLFDLSTSLSGAATALPSFDAAALWARQLAEIDAPLELTEAEIAALPLSSDEPPDLSETPWWLTDEFCGSDTAEQASWLASLPADIRAAYEDGPWDGTGEVFAAGFMHHDPGDGPAGPGFIAGGWADTAAPGPALAAAADDAATRRAELGESELIGLLCGWQRLTAWAQAGQAACLTTLVRRRKQQSVELSRPDLAQHVDDETAAALALTGRAASRLLDVATGLARLPEVGAELTAGRIDWAKACLFVDLLAGLPDEAANDIAGLVLATGDITRKTTGQLRAALTRAILAYDPDAAQRRREQARKDASVQAWTEASGNAALAGRELSPADVIHADAQLTADARWLAKCGLPGCIDELRALAYTARLTGRSLHTLLPAASTSDQASQTASTTTSPGQGGSPSTDHGGSPSTDHGGSPDLGAGGDSTTSASATSPSTDHGGSTIPDPGNPDPDSGASPQFSAAGTPGFRNGTARTGHGDSTIPDPGACQEGGPLGGTINLTMPLAAWAGLSDAPGELAGYGPADATTCRDLATRAGPATRWCLTLTDSSGRAVAHACASHPPGPPGPGSSGSKGPGSKPPGDPAGPVIRWATDLACKMQFLETGPCTHARQSARYRPPPSLAHLLRIRQRTCSYPGCRRPARRCDLDHVLPYDRGGATCECNLTPLCRRHHRAKQAPRWHLSQDQPGTLSWQLPHGRSYTTTPEAYPV
ncbi:MAG TPA: hypothetical protein VMA73_17000 [Streptosporangiaceae bacterium]|nr:hypothetical protein [Streptosporangiaceae bacterium]